MQTFLLTSRSLMLREFRHFLRQRSRITGALLTPVLLWVFIGSGVGSNFAAPLAPGGKGYLEYFYPGMLLMVILFTSIFSVFSVIEDRRAGFLRAVLVAPVSRSSIVMGKLLGTTILSVAQASLLLFLAPFLGFVLRPQLIPILIGMFFLISFGLTAFSFSLAWWFRSTQGFHAVMNVLLLPMWFLSGAVFPLEGASSWMGVLMKLNPVTYGLSALRSLLYGSFSSSGDFPSFGLSVFLTCLFAVVTFGASVLCVRVRQTLPE